MHDHMRCAARRAPVLSSSASIFNIWQLRGTRPAAFLLHHETRSPQQQRLCVGHRRRNVSLSISLFFRSVFLLLLSKAPPLDSRNPCRRRMKKTSNDDRRCLRRRLFFSKLFLFSVKVAPKVSATPPTELKVFTLTSQVKDLILCQAGGLRKNPDQKSISCLKHRLKKRQPASSCGFDLFSNCVSWHESTILFRAALKCCHLSG